MKKQAKMGHFNEESFWRLLNGIEIFTKLKLTWKQKIYIILWWNIENDIDNLIYDNNWQIINVKNMDLIGWITSFGKNDVLRINHIYNDAEKKIKNWRKQGRRIFLKCMWEGAEYDHMWS